MPPDLDVHLILDNYSTHKTPLIHRWLAKRPRFHLHFTPTYSSWLNLVETLVRGTDDEAAPPWDASERAAVGGRHLGVPRHQQCRRQAVRLDEKRR